MYDFRAPAGAVFPNGSTEIDVLLDAAGEAPIDVIVPPAPSGTSVGMLPGGGRAYYAQTPGPDNQPDDAFARRLREVPFRIWEAPDPSSEPETMMGAFFRVELGKSVKNCLEGIGTGRVDRAARGARASLVFRGEGSPVLRCPRRCAG